MAKSSIHLKVGITYYTHLARYGALSAGSLTWLELRPLERVFNLVKEGSLALISVSGTCPEETAGVRFSGIESGLSCARTDCTRRRKPVVYSHSL